MSVVQSAVNFITSGASLTTTLPVAATAGNLLVAVMTNNRSSSEAIIPTGWTEDARHDNGGGCNVCVASVIATGGETSVTYTVTTGSTRMILGVLEISDVGTGPTLVETIAAASPITVGPLNDDGMMVAAVSLDSFDVADPAFGDFDNGFTTPLKDQTEGGSNNVGQAVGWKLVDPAVSTSATITYGDVVASAGVLLAYPSTGGGVQGGQSTGTHAWAGSASGAAAYEGTADGTHSWAGIAGGENGEGNGGSASGTFAFAGTATGASAFPPSEGLAAGTFAFAGTASGVAEGSTPPVVAAPVAPPEPPTTYELVAVARTPQVAGPPLLIEVGHIVAPTITWTQELSRAGSIAFSCTTDRVDADVKNRLLHPDEFPTEVWLYRNGIKVMAGFVGGYQIQGPTLSVTAPGLLGYLAYMAVDSDQVFAGVDQTLIAKALVDQWQSLDFGNYGIDTSGITASGVLRDRAYIAIEQHKVDERLRELGAAADGFDIDVDPETRALVLSHPLQGTDLSASLILDGRNITDAGVSMSVAPGDLATEAYGLGGDGEVAITATKSNTILRAKWGRAAVMESFDGVVAQATLDQHTQALLDVRDQALFIPGPGLVPVAGADVGDFGVGDTVTYEYDAGLGVQSGAFRVVQREVSIDENGAETMAVSFA